MALIVRMATTAPERHHAADVRKHRTTKCGLPWDDVVALEDAEPNCALCREREGLEVLEVLDSDRHLKGDET